MGQQGQSQCQGRPPRDAAGPDLTARKAGPSWGARALTWPSHTKGLVPPSRPEVTSGRPQGTLLEEAHFSSGQGGPPAANSTAPTTAPVPASPKMRGGFLTPPGPEHSAHRVAPRDQPVGWAQRRRCGVSALSAVTWGGLNGTYCAGKSRERARPWLHAQRVVPRPRPQPPQKTLVFRLRSTFGLSLLPHPTWLHPPPFPQRDSRIPRFSEREDAAPSQRGGGLP